MNRRKLKTNMKGSKGKMWKKGHSCTFNPEFNKFRQEVKKGSFRFQGSIASKSNLTEASLAQHNNVTSASLCDKNDELMSVGGETAMTAFTNCTLPTFNRLQNSYNPRSILHNNEMALLAALAQTIKDKGEEETDANYFSLLVNSLDTFESDETLTAAMCLLDELVKNLKESVLKHENQKLIGILTKLLIKYMNSDHCALLRHLLSVIYCLLKVKTNWVETSEELNVVLEFTTHPKPKVRRIAQHIIRSLLIEHKPVSLTSHPCANLVAQFCIDKIESSAGFGKSVSKDIFYIMQLLEETISAFKTSYIKKCYETISRVMLLNHSMLTLCCLKSLHGLFGSNCKNLSAELNARIITALYDHEPNVTNSENLICWILLMDKAFRNLFSLDAKLCVSHMPRFFSAAVKCWLNDSKEVMKTVSTTLKSLLQNCFATINEEYIKTAVQKMFHSVEEALSYQYHKAWSHVLFVLAGFFEIAGKDCKNVMMKCLQSLGDLHGSYNFPFISDLEMALGIAVEFMGPRTVLEAIPLQADGESPDFPRSWMLPLLRNHVKRTELKFFIDYFKPLAEKMGYKAKILQQEGRLVESKLFEVVCLQIWSLLPGFCTEPKDLTMCFKDVAPKLGKLLNDDKLGQLLPLKLTILNSLRLLIKNEEHKEEMSKYAKNYIPILFNLYLTETKNKEEEKIRLAVYETCKLYIQIADRTLITIYFQTGMQKMRSSESKDFILHGTLDVCKAMISCIDEDQIKELYEYTKPLLQNENNTTKKKIYSLIKEICSSESESCKSFIKSHLSDLRLLLSETMNGLTPATRALRLNCLEHLVSRSTTDEKSTVVDIIPEAVLCTKENSVKARAAAYSLLIVIGHALHKFTPNNPKGCLKEYMTYLLAGLAGNPHFISATVLAIGRVMYEFKDELDSDIISNLISIMCELVKAKSREIVVSTLSFFKILFATVDANVLQPHVKTMISSLTSIASDNQRAFRFKAKELFTRLVRKFGYEMISKMMPPNYQKQLNNIRKIEARKQNKKERQNYGDEEEDDSDLEMYGSKEKTIDDLLADSDDDIIDDNVKVKASKSRAKKLKAQFFQEDAEDNIVDLLDPVTCNRSLTVKTENQVKRKRQNDDFKLSADGRLIIEDEDDGKKSELKSKDENNLLSDVIEPLQKKKRKFDDSDDEADKTNSAPLVHKGIHRTLESKAKRRCPGEEFKAKKAGGDIKKGKLEPYAYVPFNKMALNKRKQMKLKGQFKNFVNAAKRGASVGMKRKKENRKRL